LDEEWLFAFSGMMASFTVATSKRMNTGKACHWITRKATLQPEQGVKLNGTGADN
jgi:hypothetical protein